MSRFVKRLLPLAPESAYDNRLRQYLFDTMGDVERSFLDLQQITEMMSTVLGTDVSGAPVFTVRTVDVAVRLEPRSGAPGSVLNGMMWYDSSANKFRGYAGGSVVDFH